MSVEGIVGWESLQLSVATGGHCLAIIIASNQLPEALLGNVEVSSLRSFPEQKSKASDKGTQADEARGILTGDALLEFAVLWWSCVVFQGESC